MLTSRHARSNDLFTTMTHNTDIARACTRLHGEVIGVLLKDDAPFDRHRCRARHRSSLELVEAVCQGFEFFLVKFIEMSRSMSAIPPGLVRFMNQIE